MRYFICGVNQNPYIATQVKPTIVTEWSVTCIHVKFCSFHFYFKFFVEGTRKTIKIQQK